MYTNQGVATIFVIVIFVVALFVIFGGLDKLISKVPGLKWGVACLALIAGVSIAVSTGAWKTMSETLGIGDPSAKLGQLNMQDVPDVPSLPNIDTAQVPQIPNLNIPDIKSNRDNDGSIQFQPFNANAITPELKTEYLQDLQKIGTDVEIKPPDNQDTWSSVGGREFVFGKAWKDVDNNGCDTRNDILKRDISAYQSNSIVYKDAPKNCVVASGTLFDPYTGLTLNFIRGADTSSKVQIDHIIPLHLAWQEGAKGWTQEKREQLANDPENLVAVDGKTNTVKSDGWCGRQGCDLNASGVVGDMLEEQLKVFNFWTVPNRNYRCEYTHREIQLHQKYGLWLVPEEADTYRKTLAYCTGTELINGVMG
jgi:hypothetical protein